MKRKKEKAIEEQRASEENQRRVEAEKRPATARTPRDPAQPTDPPDPDRTQEDSGADDIERVVPNAATNGIIGTNWSSVRPEIDSKLKIKK